MKLIGKIFVAAGVFSTLFVSSSAMAADGMSGGSDLAPLAAALAIGLAAFGGALGQGKAAAAALDGIARNPSAQGKLFTPMIISLALIESLVIYGLLIAMKLAAFF